MVNAEDIKQIATPQSVARYLLGSPEKERRNELWYCSPFRRETQASFVVSDKGFHDFGTGEHYDIFSFIQKLKHCSFKESVNILASLFGVADREYDSNKSVEWYKKQREEKQRYEQILDWFYLKVWDETDKEQKMNNELLELLKPTTIDDINEAYAVLLDVQVSVAGMEEHLATSCNTSEEKEELMKQAMRGDLPTWLMNRLKATMTLLILNTKLKQRREY